MQKVSSIFFAPLDWSYLVEINVDAEQFNRNLGIPFRAVFYYIYVNSESFDEKLKNTKFS